MKKVFLVVNLNWAKLSSVNYENFQGDERVKFCVNSNDTDINCPPHTYIHHTFTHTYDVDVLLISSMGTLFIQLAQLKSYIINLPSNNCFFIL